MTACSVASHDARSVGANGGDGGASSSVTAGATGGGAPSAPLLATAVALGTSHSCAVLVGGQVACWGDGSSGQLGDGVAAPGHESATPLLVPGLASVRGIRAGGDTTCAILEESVVCWGAGAYGQLGNGMASDEYASATPVPVSGLGVVVDVSVGAASACAVTANGGVLCWGRNTSQGWLGFTSDDCGPYTDMASAVDEPCEKVPRAVPGVSGAVAVATSGDDTCAVMRGGALTCWGADDFGQLGDGFSGSAPHDPSPVGVGGISDVLRVALGATHACAVSGTAEAAYCWGDNSEGQLGIGSEQLDSNRSTPVSVPGLEHVVDLDAAAGVTCAAIDDGSVKCWGDPSSLFPASVGARTTSPVAANGIAHAASVRTGGTHACAIRDDQTVVCWGLDDMGQLGNGELSLGDYQPTPVGAP
jgi:alpha-tubulin suppressor-like RCC1 family protein